ncbi:MAG: hypothetical protein NT078_00015, partial [Candidatus Azambacteria bacterium]|nr:hypothetical protein [Candidatus Azambacteria bacterium]
MELSAFTSHELLEKLTKKESTVEQISDSLRARIKSIDTKVKSYVRPASLNSILTEVSKNNGYTSSDGQPV